MGEGDLQELVRCPRLLRILVERLVEAAVERVAVEAAAHCRQLLDSDVPTVRNIRAELGDRIVELELPLLHQLHDDGRRHRLGVAADTHRVRHGERRGLPDLAGAERRPIAGRCLPCGYSNAESFPDFVAAAFCKTPSSIAAAAAITTEPKVM